MTSLIIPAYSTTPESVKMVKDCLASLKYGKPDEVIVVDDGSPILFEDDNVIMVRVFPNMGYVHAVNEGLEHTTGDILIMGNSDLLFAPGWLEGLLRPLDEGCDVSTVITSDQEHKIKNATTIGDRFGSLWAMKRIVYEAMGPLDQRFKQFFADTDYYVSLKEAGFVIGKNWRIEVEHENHATFNVNPKSNTFEDDKAKFLAKHGFII